MTRVEVDGLGEIELPVDAVFGSQTQRAIENFPITGVPISHYSDVVRCLAMVKKACALTNAKLGVLPRAKADVIAVVCDEIISGQHHVHFVVDVIQGGAGTSTNMNINEVISNLCLVKMGHKLGDYQFMHPNDDVNKSQSTNDVYPTAVRLAVVSASKKLVAALDQLGVAFVAKAEEFSGVRKIGRTQLQDAVPMSLGDEFASFAHTIREDIDRVRENANLLREVNLGGTAIGTMINAPKGFQPEVVAQLEQIFGSPVKPAANLIEASSDLGAFVSFSGTLKRIGVKLSKICNDLRLMSSGPRAGIGEIELPAVQAGSSIMPGKVNPVIPEVVNQVCFQAIGNDLIVTMAAESGQLQLNAMEPIVVHKSLESTAALSQAITVLTERCVRGINADRARCSALLNNSLALATSLAPILGYEKAAQIAKTAQKRNCSLLEAVEQSDLQANPEISRILTNEF